MRIGFVSTLTGGSWAASEELWGGAAMRMLENSHKVAVCVKYWPVTAQRVAEMEQRGAQVFTWRQGHDHWFYKTWNAIDWRERPEYRRMRRFRPDLVVISQGSHTDGLPWMKFCSDAGLPYVAISQCNADIWWVGDGAAAELAAGYLAARKVCCVSRHNLELLEWQIGHPLPNGCVVWNPHRIPPSIQPWPQGDTVRLACVARLNPTAKGQDLLLRVLALQRWRERKVEANFYGWLNPFGNVLKRMAERLDLKNVRFHDQVADVNSIWSENHLLVMPSRFEGLPLALVETMLNARAAVVTDVGGNKEVCIDGATGFIAPAPTLELLDITLERAWLYRADWEEMGWAALARIQKLLPPDPIGDFCSLLADCVSKN